MTAAIERINNESRSTSVYMNDEHLDGLKALADKREVAGRKPSISQLVAEAVDEFLKAKGFLK